MVRPDDDSSPGFVRTLFRRGPSWLPSVWRIGWRGAALLFGLGLALVLIRVVVSWPEVADIQDQYGANVGALAVIVLAQVALLGNAATWALSFLAGPGFQIALGSTVSPAAAQPGLLPLVPLFGALPGATDFPTTMYAVVLAPVVLGAWLGGRVDAALEFFGNVQARLAATATAAFLAVLVVVGTTALGNGAVGVDRLAAVGPHLWTFAAALLAEVVGGALLWLGVLLLRERLASRRGRDAGSGATDDEARDDAEASTSV
jgi:hypothetical protein